MLFCVLMLEKQDGGLLVYIVDFDDVVLFMFEVFVNDVIVGDVLICVDWLIINYKDGLVIIGKGFVVCKWLMVVGIDGVGVVFDLLYLDWWIGDVVVFNGWGVGEMYWGCFVQQVWFFGDWLVVLFVGLDVWQVMVIGMVGYMVMLLVLVLECVGVKLGDGEVLVIGVLGGVGLIVIVLFGKLGYCVVVLIGKMSEVDFLQVLGVMDVIDCVEFFVLGKLLQKECWVVVVDLVGLYMLVNVCVQVCYGGVVMVCGLVQGMDFLVIVVLFILCGVMLYGIDSVMVLCVLCQIVWQCLVVDLLFDCLVVIMCEVMFFEVIGVVYDIVVGKMCGCVVVDVN